MSNLTTIQSLQSDDYFEKVRERWLSMKLEEKVFTEELQFAIMLLSQSEELQKCDAKTVLNSILSVASTGLSLNPVKKLAYLIPYRGSCKLMPSYQGLEKLLTDCGSIKALNVQIVYEGDEIEIDLASKDIIKKHIPYLITGKTKGNIKFVYSIATLQDNSKHVELMDKTEIEYIRDNCSEGYKAEKKYGKLSIWTSHEGEMFRKTVVKRHIKHLPKSSHSDFVYNAVEADNEAGGFDIDVSFEQLGYIESLIHTSGFDVDKKDYLLRVELPSIETKAQANRFIEHLRNNQAETGNFRQSDIAKQVKSTVERPNT